MYNLPHDPHSIQPSTIDGNYHTVLTLKTSLFTHNKWICHIILPLIY